VADNEGRSRSGAAARSRPARLHRDPAERALVADISYLRCWEGLVFFACQYTSIDDTQTLADHQVLASVGSVGDAYDNALAESFLDGFKTS
jgi:hypothetical protein